MGNEVGNKSAFWIIVIFCENLIDLYKNLWVFTHPLRKAHLLKHCSKGLSDIHHPDIHHLRHSSPQTFITPYVKSDIHHPGHSSPQTFITLDIHHPPPKIRHSSPRTFITSDVHHLRHSSPQTFITPYLNSDIHHLRRSSPQTFITP